VYSTQSWHLIQNEVAFKQFETIETAIKANFGNYKRNARIVFTTYRIIAEVYSTLGGIKSIIIINLSEIKSIRISSEFANHGLSISDYQGNSVWFNFFRKNLRGIQIYLQIFYCAYATWRQDPSKVLERMTGLHNEAIVPADLFQSDVYYQDDFQRLLEEWGVVLVQNDIPRINNDALIYRQHWDLQNKNADTKDTHQSGSKQQDSENRYVITEVLAESGEVVYKNQAVLRIRSCNGIVEKNICAGETGYIRFNRSSFSGRYTLEELMSIFSVKAGKYNSSKRRDLTKDEENCTKKSASNTTHDLNSRIRSLINEFDSLPGLNSAKEIIKDIASISQVNQKRKDSGLDPINITNHMVFTGNPGTGKTTIARKMGKIFKELGLLSKGHFVEVQRSDLVGGYLGQTAIKTQAVIDKSLGGILFIDEAYSLASDDQFGTEAINTLITAMENHRNDLIVIAAGYEREMSNLLNSNPGMQSRFAKFVNFEDYSDEELLKIFEFILHKMGMNLDRGCMSKAEEIITLIGKERGKGFGNAREVRKLIDSIITIQSKRLSSSTLNGTDLKLITIEDLESARLKIVPRLSSEKTSTLDDIKNLIGLEAVKSEITKLISQCKINVLREKAGLKVSRTSLHMVFTGNPGTGKTTIARIVAQSLYEIGVTKKNLLVEASRPDLVAGYIGQTALKTQKVLEQASGGVIFIDEAYSLHDPSDKHNFGKEAIEVILKFMEDNKDNIVVILAGYSGEINALLDSNPGLKSRFNRFIHFNDYTPFQLCEIFKEIALKFDYHPTDKFLQRLNSSINLSIDKKQGSFGNGRAVRNLFEKVIERQAERLNHSQPTTAEELRTLNELDLFDSDIIDTMSN